MDIGGTNTVMGMVDSEGKIVAEGSFKTQEFPVFEDYAEQISREIDAMGRRLSFEFELIGIGIGAPNANFFTGRIENPANLSWTRRNSADDSNMFPLVELIKRDHPTLPVLMTNDANAAAVGEMVYGGAKGMKDFVVVTLGTGLGSGFVANGNLIYGHDSFAGELGHITVVRNGRTCGCGRKGCLETYVSATGIRRTVFELLSESMEPSVFRKISFEQLDAKMITSAAIDGDHIALEAFERTGAILGPALADMIAITSPEAIFLFGGLSKAGKYIFEPTQRYMEQSILRNFKGKVKLLPSGIDDRNAAVLGAAALAWQALK